MCIAQEIINSGIAHKKSGIETTKKFSCLLLLQEGIDHILKLIIINMHLSLVGVGSLELINSSMSISIKSAAQVHTYSS